MYFLKKLTNYKKCVNISPLVEGKSKISKKLDREKLRKAENASNFIYLKTNPELLGNARRKICDKFLEFN